jgi:4a-hydroxytetrahydrobiopterin dehydratase
VPYTAGQAEALMGQLHEGWRVTQDGKALRREFGFRDFYRTMGFANALAHVANAEDHHPDLELGYNYCNVRFSTHDAGGLTEKDFICAAKTDALA